MNLLLVEPAELATDRSGSVSVTLPSGDRRCIHLRTVSKVTLGTQVPTGVRDGGLGDFEVAADTGEGLELRGRFTMPAPARRSVHLFLALPRPKTLRRILQATATFGLERVTLFGAWRVEKSYWDSPVLMDASLRHELTLGLEQGMDTVAPEVTFERLFRPFVEDRLPGQLRGRTAYLAQSGPEVTCPVGETGPVSLIVGPEAGFNAFERGLLCEAGAAEISLGQRVLRVEQAIPALLGRLL